MLIIVVDLKARLIMDEITFIFNEKIGRRGLVQLKLIMRGSLDVRNIE